MGFIENMREKVQTPGGGAVCTASLNLPTNGQEQMELLDNNFFFARNRDEARCGTSGAVKSM